MQLKAIVERYSGHIKNTGIYLLSSVLSSLFSLLINPLLAKNLSPEDYGIIGYYGGFSALFSPLIGYFILDFFLRKYFLYSPDDRLRLRNIVVKLYVIFSGLIALGCFIALYLYNYCAQVIVPTMPYAAIFILESYILTFYNLRLAEYKMAGESTKFLKLSLANGVLIASFSVLLVVILKMGAFGKMLASFTASFTVFAYCFSKYRGAIKCKIDKAIFKEIIHYSSPLVFAGLLGFFSKGYDKVLLERQGDLSNLGIYSVGFTMACYLDTFSSAVKSTFQPDVYKALAEKNFTKLLKTMLIVIGFVAFIVVSFWLVCPFLIKILFAGRYDAAIPFARILSLSILTSTIYYQISQATYGSGLSNLTLINKIIGTILTIFLYTLLIPHYGTIGAAWSVVLSYLIYALSNVILLLLNKKKFLR
jgi:O-antigen/teichoic acid export membrane protein